MGRGRRLRRLEARIPTARDLEAERALALEDPLWDEIADHRAPAAKGCSRGGVPIEPVDAPTKILGDNYSWNALWDLAQSRVLERGHNGA
jgi:hypothetical protein